MDHTFGRKTDGAPSLTDRMCRPGAAYGPQDVEASMGVTAVFHELTEPRTGQPGKLRCKTCGEIDAS